jgi:hypothetical protein
MSSSAALLLLVACSSVTPATPTEANEYRPADDVGERAEQVLRSDAPFDLRLPGAKHPRRQAANDALVVACRAGHHPSCRTLLVMATSEDALAAAASDVVEQCRKDDLISCQALPPHHAYPFVPEGLPGEMGRLLAQDRRTVTEEQAVELRRECSDGFAYSCKALADGSPDLAERPAMHEKLTLAARAGCRHKLPYVCLLVEDTWPEAERIAALDWNCQIWRNDCAHLGAALLDAGRLDAARGEYERACQYGSEWYCLELAELYRDGTLAEPVDGRRATIVRIACAVSYMADEPACASRP